MLSVSASRLPTTDQDRILAGLDGATRRSACVGAAAGPVVGRKSLRARGARWVAAAVLVALAVAATAAAAEVDSSGAAAATQRFSLYSVATRTQYVNNADDRQRGEGNNPFGNYQSGGYVPPPPNEKIYGPFPGDEGEYAFDLRTSPARKTNVGTAIFICQYNFNQGSFCDAAFQLNGGSLIGKGSLNFNSSAFTLAIVGGTYKYRAMSGDVVVTARGVATQAQPVARAVPMLQSQRLDFVLHDA
jgi:hypothetical protein